MWWAPIAASVVGGILGKRSDDRTNASNRRSVQETNRTNIALAERAFEVNSREAKRARQFARNQVQSARRYDERQNAKAFKRNQQQVREARRYNERQLDGARAYEATQEDARWRREVKIARNAEERGRKYAAEDRDEHRAYNHPSAVRKRLEDAGINPLSGVDNSGGFVASSGSIVPGSPNPVAPTSVRSDIAEMVAARSGVAPGTFAEYRPAQVQAPVAQHTGQNIVGAMNAVADGMYQQAEQELRRTQLDMENRRLTMLAEEAMMRPIVPGVYGHDQGYASAVAAGASGAPGGVVLGPGAAQPFRSPGDELSFGGLSGETQPDTNNAEDFETRYGEVGGSLVGLGVMLRDGYSWARQAASNFGPSAADWVSNTLTPAMADIGSAFDTVSPQRDLEPWRENPDAQFYDSFNRYRDGAQPLRLTVGN